MPALADVAPAVLAALGLQEPGALALPPARRVCLLLVDGLGDVLLAQHAELAPALTALRTGALEAGYPSSTPTSLASLSTGLAPGEHGVTGVVTRFGDVPVTTLGWTADGVDARERVPPHEAQPRATLFERVVGAGRRAVQVGPAAFEGSGFTEALLRGAVHRGLDRGDDLAAATVEEARGADLVYAYTSALDTAGHLHGPGSDPWRAALADADRLVARLRTDLPGDCLLLVTGDHGVVAPAERVDLDARDDLRADVHLVTGEARALNLHTDRPDAVHARWAGELAGRADVALRADALAAGWWGPVAPAHVDRLGDVVVRCGPDLAVVQREAEPVVAALVGLHGGSTDEEVQVPLVVATG